MDARRQREVVLLLLARTVCLRPVYLSPVYLFPVYLFPVYLHPFKYFLKIFSLTNCPYCALPPPPPSPTSREGGSCSQSASEEIYLNFGKIIQRQYFQKYVSITGHPQIQG